MSDVEERSWLEERVGNMRNISIGNVLDLICLINKIPKRRCSVESLGFKSKSWTEGLSFLRKLVV